MSELQTIGEKSMTNEIKKRGRGRPRINAYTPPVLTCKVTGEKIKTNPHQFNKQLQKSGLTYDQFIESYVSRKGKRLLREKEASKTVVVIEKKVTKENTEVVDNFDNSDLDFEDEAKRAKEFRLLELNKKLEKIACIRSYPVTCYDTVMDTYMEYMSENMIPKEAWKMACHLHRNSPRIYEEVKKWDERLPYQKD